MQVRSARVRRVLMYLESLPAGGFEPRTATNGQDALRMLTGVTLGEERERAEASGIDAFVLKPCLPNMLASEIRRVRDESSGVL